MIPRYVSDFVTLLLPVILMVAFSIPLTKQCKLTTTERDGSVIIRNVGIKQCRLKCAASGQNVSAQYDIETLTCHLLSAKSRKTKTKEGHVNLARKHSNVSAGSCSSKCSFGQRCVKTRSGKFTCEDEKNFPEKSQQKVVKEDTLANNPLHEACREGNLTRVRHIVSQGLVDINSRDGNHGKTPLMVAAQGGHCRIVTFLVKIGANMSQVDNDGENFLHWACKGGHVSMVECVVPLYNVVIDNIMPTPLVQAAFLGHRDVCEFLVCMGANVSHVDGGGDSALHWACKGGDLDVVKYLLPLSSVPIDSRGSRDRTPLMAAALMGHTDVGQFLVSMGANLSKVDDLGQNVLHYCCQYGRLELMKSVLSQGNVDINGRDLQGWTPLMKAVLYDERKLFDLLVSKGALTHLVNDRGNNILHLASLSGRVEIVKHILSQNMTDINARNKKRKTAAMTASHARRFRVYNLLVSRGCLLK